MGHADYYEHGSYNVICDECGFKFKRHELKWRWDGLLVCKRDWEPQHPQDFVEGRRDDLAVPDPRPEPTAVWVTVPVDTGDFIVTEEGDRILTEEGDRIIPE